MTCRWANCATATPSPVPTVLLFVSAVVFLVGACVLGFAR